MRVPTRKPNGFALIDLIFVIGMIGVLSAIAFPRLMLAKHSAGAASAIGSLRAISSAQLTFALTCGAGFYAPNLTTLGTPPPASVVGFISPTLGTADTVTRGNFIITMQATPFPGAPASCNGVAFGGAGQAFKAAADPAYPPFRRYFAVNANAQIWEHTASLLAVMPEAGEPPVGFVLR
jgi:type II secretory pathway pseudopilin PulG